MGFSAHILISDTHSITYPIPLNVDNGLPGIELWFGTDLIHEIGIIFHMDTCVAINTSNLMVHKWLVTQNPELVAEYIQFDDAYPFDPIQVHCAVEYLATIKSMYSRLTVIVRYWLRYKQDGRCVLLSFGLGDSVAVNSLIVIPTVKVWKALFDFELDSMIARALHAQFPLIIEATKHGLPPGIIFSASAFVRPLRGAQYNDKALLANLDNDDVAPEEAKSALFNHTTGAIIHTTYDCFIHRNFNVSHI